MRHIVLFSTNPRSNRGGIANAVSGFLSCMVKLDVQFSVQVTHEPSAGRFLNSCIFLRAIFRFLALALMARLPPNRGDRLCVYLHVGPRGSLIRKLLIALIARGSGVKVLTHYHSPTFDDYINHKGIWRFLLFALTILSNQNLVLSQWWKERFVSVGVKNVSIVPNCIGEAIRAHPFSFNRKIEHSTSLLSLGRLEPGKNFDLLIRAMTYLPDSMTLQIGGEGSEQRKLLELVSELELTDRVRLIGWIDESTKVSLYESSDLFILPSNYDSFGMVFIEALSHGCPVAISPNPIVISALTNLPGVFISVDFSPESVAETILIALKSQVDRAALSRCCIDRYGIESVSLILAEALDIE